MEHFFLVKTLHNVPKPVALDHLQLPNSERAKSGEHPVIFCSTPL